MDINTLLSLIGSMPRGGGLPTLNAAQAPVSAPTAAAQTNVAAMMNGDNGGQPHFGGGSEGNPPGVLSLAQTPTAAPISSAATPAKKGGFSTGNILQALLGSNFGM